MDQGQSDPLAYLLNFGVLGLFLVLWLTGRIVSKSEHDRAVREGQEWKLRFEQEAAAHDVTRRAMDQERTRSDSSIEAARMGTALLSALSHHSQVPPAVGP